MSDYTQYTTLSGSGLTLSVNSTQSSDRPKTPAGLIVTQVVQTKDGWLGLVIVDKDIVWQSAPKSDAQYATEAANKVVVTAVKDLIRRAGIELT